MSAALLVSISAFGTLRTACGSIAVFIQMSKQKAHEHEQFSDERYCMLDISDKHSGNSMNGPNGRMTCRQVSTLKKPEKLKAAGAKT